MLTPTSVHHGQANGVLDNRHQVLTEAAERHPLRFKHRQPKRVSLPEAVWINKPRVDDQPLTPEETR